jgi:sulfide dehydrogenase cytochrome subunit
MVRLDRRWRRAAKFAALGCAALLSSLLADGAAAADASNLIESCATCHGKDGISPDAGMPVIAGFSVQYVTNQLTEYRSKKRPCPETEIRSGEKKGTKSDMCQSAKDLSDADIEQVANYYGKKKFVRTQQNFDPALAKKGKEIHNDACDKCHQEEGSLPTDDSGILAGQRMQYLKAQLEDYKSGNRIPFKKMKPKVTKLQRDDIDALVNYYGSQR